MKHVEMIIDYVVDGDDFIFNDNRGVLVRCKECKYYRKNISCVGGLYNGCSEWLNEGNEIEVREDDFCSYGERREDE